MGIYVFPGWKICPNCLTECYRKTEIINEEIDEPDYAFSSDDEVNNWNTTENRDVMNSTLNELELTPFKFMLYLDIRKLLMENENWLKLTMRC